LADEIPGSGDAPRIGRSISIDHAAELLGVSRRTIYNHIRSGRLQTIRTIGGSQRVLVDSMSRAVSSPGTPPYKDAHLPAGRRPAL